MNKRASDEFGTFDWEAGWGKPDADSNPRAAAMDELETRIAAGRMPRLGEREAIEDDDFMPHNEEFHGPKPKGPTIPEMQKLRTEWEPVVDNHLAGKAPQHETVTHDISTPEQAAELLWNEFKAAYPAQARDANRVEAVAKRIIEEGGLDLDNRAAFYKRVSEEIRNG